MAGGQAHDQRNSDLWARFVRMKRSINRLWISPTFTTWGSLVVRFASVVLLLPLVLVRFSAAEVAVWQLFSALFVLGLMLDYGLAPTFSRLLSFARSGMAIEHMGRVDGNQAQPTSTNASDSSTEVFATMRWLYPRLATVVTFVLMVLGTWSLQTPIHQLPQPAVAWLAWGFVVVTVQLTLWGACYSGALMGMDKIAPMRRWEIAFGCAQIVSSLAVIWFGGGLLELVATYQVWAVLGALRNRWLLKLLHPELFNVPAAKSDRVIKVAWSPAWRSVVGVLSSHGVIQLSGLAYGQIAPAAEVASYLLALRLITTVSQFSQAPFYSKLPQLAMIHATGNRTEVMRLVSRGMTLAHWVFVAGALGAAWGAPMILEAIGSNTGFVSYQLFSVMAIAFFIERFGAMHMQIYSLTNHVIYHIGNMITGLSICALTYLLIPHVNILSFPIAMLVSYLFIYCPFAIKHSLKIIPVSIIKFEATVGALPAAALTLGLVGIYLSGESMGK